MNEWLQKEYVLRVASLVLAIMLWFVVNEPTFSFLPEKETTRIQDVYVEARYDSSQFELSKMNHKVELVVTGNKYTIDHLLPTYRVYVDLHGFGEGTHQVKVQVEGLPAGVQAKVKPNTITVQLEEKGQKEVPVEVQVEGQSKNGFEVGTPKVDTEKVWVKGTMKQLEKVKSVKGFVSAQSLTQTTSKMVRLKAYGDEGPVSGVTLTPNTVRAHIPVTVPSKKVPLHVNVSKGPPSGYRVEKIEISPSTGTIYGPSSYLDSLQSYLVTELDLSKATQGKRFQIQLPRHGKAVQVEPQKVEIYVKIVPVNQNSEPKPPQSQKPSKPKEIKKTIPIEIIGRKEDMQAEILQPSNGKVTLTIRGNPQAIDNMEPGDIQAYSDVSGLSEGRHQVPIQVYLPPELELVNQSDEEATIQLTSSDEETQVPPEDGNGEPPPPSENEEANADKQNEETETQTSSNGSSQSYPVCIGDGCYQNG